MPLVEQIDAELSDDGVQIFFHVYLTDQTLTGGAPLLAIADLPAPITEREFDRRAYADAFWAAGAPSLARN